MQNGPRPVALQQGSHQNTIGNVSMHKLVAPIIRDGFQVTQIPCVRQLVQVHDGIRLLLDALQDEVRTDKAGSARNEDRIFHEWKLLWMQPQTPRAAPPPATRPIVNKKDGFPRPCVDAFEFSV
jgi:hypothetical protein